MLESLGPSCRAEVNVLFETDQPQSHVPAPQGAQILCSVLLIEVGSIAQGGK
jgi:hypothetical protein